MLFLVYRRTCPVAMSTGLMANGKAGTDQDDPAARAHQPGHAAQRPDVVLDVLEHVVRHRAGVGVHLVGRQQHLPDSHPAVSAEPLFERHQAPRIGFCRGEAGEVRGPLQRVVAQAAADLDRVVAEERYGQFDEPPAMVNRRGEAFEDLGLHALVAVDSRHMRLQIRWRAG